MGKTTRDADAQVWLRQVGRRRNSMHEILRDISQAEIEELRRQVESKRATRQRLIETLGEPRVTCHLQPIELTSTLVRIRLPRKHSFSEERLYAVGIALRAVASTNSAGKPTWIFQCDMGESKLHETDIMYISTTRSPSPKSVACSHLSANTATKTRVDT